MTASVIPFFIVGVMAVLTIALGGAMRMRPDELEARTLTGLLVGGLGWSALVMVSVNSMVHFGLVIPLIAGIALYAIYRIGTRTNFVPLYRYALVFGVVTVLSTILVAGQYFTVRSIS